CFSPGDHPSPLFPSHGLGSAAPPDTSAIPRLLCRVRWRNRTRTKTQRHEDTKNTFVFFVSSCLCVSPIRRFCRARRLRRLAALLRGARALSVKLADQADDVGGGGAGQACPWQLQSGEIDPRKRGAGEIGVREVSLRQIGAS